MYKFYEYRTLSSTTDWHMVEVCNNYLLTYDSSGPVYNRFHRGEWIRWVSWG
jgi:hypothetical protein